MHCKLCFLFWVAIEYQKCSGFGTQWKTVFCVVGIFTVYIKYCYTLCLHKETWDHPQYMINEHLEPFITDYLLLAIHFKWPKVHRLLLYLSDLAFKYKRKWKLYLLHTIPCKIIFWQINLWFFNDRNRDYYSGSPKMEETKIISKSN